MGLKELQAKLKEDGALAEKFKACKNIDDVIELAKVAGFEISLEDIEKLTNVSAEDLTKAAGGTFLIDSDFVVIAYASFGLVK